MINILFSPTELILPIMSFAVPASFVGLTYLGVMVGIKINDHKLGIKTNEQYYSFSSAVWDLYSARLSPKLKKMIRKEGIRKENGELADLPEKFSSEDYYSGNILISEFESAIDYYMSKGLIFINSANRKEKLEKNLKNDELNENHSVLTVSLITKNNKKIEELSEKIDEKKSLLELINEEYDKLNTKLNTSNMSNTNLVDERVSLEVLKESISDIKDILDKRLLCIDDLIKLVQEKQKVKKINEKLEKDIYDNSFDEETKDETRDSSIEKYDTDNIDIIEKKIDSILVNYNANSDAKTNNADQKDTDIAELVDMRKKTSLKLQRISILNKKIEKAVDINIYQSYKNTEKKKIDNLKEKYDYDKKMIKEEYISNDQISDEKIQIPRRMH